MSITTHGLSDVQSNVLAHLDSPWWRTTSQVARALSIDQKKAYACIASLYARDLLERRAIEPVGSGRYEWRRRVGDQGGVN